MKKIFIILIAFIFTLNSVYAINLDWLSIREASINNNLNISGKVSIWENVDNITIKNVNITTKKGEKFSWVTIKNATISNYIIIWTLEVKEKQKKEKWYKKIFQKWWWISSWWWANYNTNYKEDNENFKNNNIEIPKSNETKDKVWETTNNTEKKLTEAQKNYEEARRNLNMSEEKLSKLGDLNSLKSDLEEKRSNLNSQNKEVEKKKEEFKKAHDEACKESWTCFEKTSWMLNVWTLTPWWAWKWWSIEEQTDSIFSKIINFLMVLIWSLSLLIMTIWWWYMILHNWQDELLSKWKSIFMSWIYALIISLSAYIIVKAIIKLIY